MIPIADSITSRRPPIATTLIIITNLVVFTLQTLLPPQTLQRVVYLFGLVPARYTHPDSWTAATGLEALSLWPFLTSVFLHGGLLHVGLNMWMLWIFGDNVEDRMGSIRFVAFYLLCGVLASLVYLSVNPSSTAPSIGASGAISGVLGAYFLLYPNARVVALIPILFIPLFFALPAVVFIGFWFVIQLYSGALAAMGPENATGVAWWAHIGGFMAGLALAALFLDRRDGARAADRDHGQIERARDAGQQRGRE